MVLGKNEELLRTWEYGESSTGRVIKTKTHYSLAVTNKRIVATEKSSVKNKRDEIMISDVQSISVSHSEPSHLAAILMIVFGILLAVVAIAALDGILKIVGIVIGVLLLIAGIARLQQGSISVTVVTRGTQTSALSLGLSRMFKKLAGKTVKIKVNNDIAEEIVESLGAYVLVD